MFLCFFGCFFAVLLITVRVSATKVVRGDFCLRHVGSFLGIFRRQGKKINWVGTGTFWQIDGKLVQMVIPFVGMVSPVEIELLTFCVVKEILKDDAVSTGAVVVLEFAACQAFTVAVIACVSDDDDSTFFARENLDGKMYLEGRTVFSSYHPSVFVSGHDSPIVKLKWLVFG